MDKSSFCPICRKLVTKSANCLLLDNFLNDFSEVVGGNLQHDRVKLTEESEYDAFTHTTISSYWSPFKPFSVKSRALLK